MALKSLRDAENTFTEMAKTMLAIREESQNGLASLQETLLAAIAGSNGHKHPANAAGVNGKAKSPANGSAKPTATAPPVVPIEEVVEEEELTGADQPESVVEILDNADRSAAPVPKADRGAARDIVAGSFRLRKSSRGGSGSILWPEKIGRKGIASTPLADDTMKKVTVQVQVRRKDGSMVKENVEKSQNLHDITRNVIGPLAADQYYTVIDNAGDDAPVGRTGRRKIRFAQLDDNGHVIPKTESLFRLSTSESGSLMLSGELSAKMHLQDETGKATVLFTPVARGVIYLMGKDYVRQS